MISLKSHWVKKTAVVGIGLAFGFSLVITGMIARFEKYHHDRVLPYVFAGDTHVGGMTKDELESYFISHTDKYDGVALTLLSEEYTATISAEELDVRYDINLITQQAFQVGRSGNMLTDAYIRFTSFVKSTIRRDRSPLVQLAVPLAYNNEIVEEKIELASQFIDVAPIEPVFEFDESTDRVKTFRLGKNGKQLDTSKLHATISDAIQPHTTQTITINLPIEVLQPTTGDADIDSLGIVELLASGDSYFTDSIPGRVYNIELAASRVNGVLLAPGETMSFNDVIGDISAATGYKSAYVIKAGKTILDDGGGVCQVSTTVFRAALNAGLEIEERRPHSYRVSYYEQGGFKPGLDATIYPPYVDLKIKNNTDHHVLFESEFDRENARLTYRVYGKDDGRSVYLSDIRTYGYADPPPPVYQEDPTLPSGKIKQIEKATPGIKSEFDYKVEKNGLTLSDTTIKSSFVPWQAVYLYGPGTEVPAQ